MQEKDVRVGLRVMVPQRMVHDTYPWQERYGKVIGVESFLGTRPLIRVLLDGDSAVVITCRAEDLDFE